MLLLRIIYFLIALPFTHAAYSYSLEQQLRDELFVTNSYNRMTRPTDKVFLAIQLNMLTLKELNIRDQYISIIGYFVIKWNELQRLNWITNPTYNTDITYIFCTENEIWVPPVMIQNSVDNIGMISDSTIRIRVTATGGVTWSPTNIFTTNCVTDVTYYPFDSQTCDIIMTSWGYTRSELAFLVDNKVPLGMNNYQENGEWEYVGYTVENGLEQREAVYFFQIKYSLTFKRRPAYHIYNSIVPMVVISSLASFVFKLPVDAGEKMGYALTILLTSAVYLTLVSDSIPTTSLNTPYLTTYLIALLIMEVISVILTVLVLDFHHESQDVPVPNWLKFLLGEVVARMICWKSKCSSCCKRKKEDDLKNNKVIDLSREFEKQEEITPDEKQNESDVSWQDMAKILDIFFFRLYFLALVAVTLIFLLFMTLY